MQLGLMGDTATSGIYSVSGFIEAEEVNVTAEIRGRIIRLAVEEGDLVQAGQMLVELDPALIEVQMHQVQAKRR